MDLHTRLRLATLAAGLMLLALSWTPEVRGPRRQELRWVLRLTGAVLAVAGAILTLAA